MKELLESIFDNKLESDERDPFTTLYLNKEYSSSLFRLFSFFSGSLFASTENENDHEDSIFSFAIFLPQTEYWIQLIAFVAITTTIGFLLATVIYYHIIPNRKAPTTFLLGYGLIIPLSAAYPFYLMSVLDLRNAVFITYLSGNASLFIFRCMAALHDTSPPFVESKYSLFCLYFCCPANFIFDLQTGDAIKTKNIRSVLWTIPSLVYQFILLGTLFSILDPLAYKIFDEDSSIGSSMLCGTSDGHGILCWFQSVLHWKHLVNNLLVAFVTSLTLKVNTFAFEMIISTLSGIEVMECTRNPLFGSSSPSDFWGQRWNNVVNRALKGAIYKPLRKSASPIIAAITTFLASGVLHEYVLLVINLSNSHFITTVAKQNEGEFRYGPHTIFFLWNAVIISLEYLFRNQWERLGIVAHRLLLPKFIVSLLVVLCVLPVGHLFTDEYITNGLYTQSKVAFPGIMMHISSNK